MTTAQGAASAAKVSQEAAAGFAEDSKQAVAGLDLNVSAQIDSQLNVTLASYVALRAVAGSSTAKFELAALSDPAGSRAVGVMTGDLQSNTYSNGKTAQPSRGATGKVAGFEFWTTTYGTAANGHAVIIRTQRSASGSISVSQVNKTVIILVRSASQDSDIRLQRSSIVQAIENTAPTIRARGSGQITLPLQDTSTIHHQVSLTGGANSQTLSARGWIIRRDGTAEFDASVIRGTLKAENIDSDVRNWQGIWSGSKTITEGTSSTITVTGDPAGYRKMVVFGYYTADSPAGRAPIEAAFDPSYSGVQRSFLPGLGTTVNDSLSIPSGGIKGSVITFNVEGPGTQTCVLTDIFGVNNPATAGPGPGPGPGPGTGIAAPGLPTVESDFDISAANPTGNTTTYFATFEYSTSSSFASGNKKIYDTVKSTTHRSATPIPSGDRTGTVYIRARLTTAINDGGTQGAWSATRTHSFGSGPGPSALTATISATPGTNVAIGVTVNLRCNVTGGGSGSITYAWQGLTSQGNWISAQARSSATGPRLRDDDGGTGRYRCVVTRGGVTVISNVLAITWA